MNSIILKELLSNASRHKGEPLPAAIKIIVDYTKDLEVRICNQKEQENKHLKYIGELEARIDELEEPVYQVVYDGNGKSGN